MERCLEIREPGSIQGLEIGCVIVLCKDKALVLMIKGGDATGVLPYLPEMGVVQPQ